MNGAVVIEGVVLSFLLALWMTWIGLRGLFRLLLDANGQVERAQLMAKPQNGIQDGHVA